tara:strand:+ start:198769 stop:198933 length:165 start_codon:yes stop_codon:yes gene_type:complete
LQVYLELKEVKEVNSERRESIMKKLLMFLMVGMFGISFVGCDREGPLEQRADNL